MGCWADRAYRASATEVGEEEEEEEEGEDWRGNDREPLLTSGN